MTIGPSVLVWIALLSGSPLAVADEPVIVTPRLNGQDAAGLSATGGFNLEERRREHWVWQPVRTELPPAVEYQSWPKCAIDCFVLAPLEKRGIVPGIPAEKRVLIRRVYFDLIGLPPTPDEIDAFVEDAAPDSFDRVVNRLLSSPKFGERWGRHWLDLVRYAETRGHEFDHLIPNAYQYRDYVIRALNGDVPYHQFVTEHIAGDLVDPPRLHPTNGFNESVLGTGFWFLGEELHSPVDIRGDETDRVDNKIDVYSKTFLGLTVSCARCHDHKFDAIAMHDYYALAGFVLSSSYRQVPFESMEHNRRLLEEIESLQVRSRPTIVQAIATTHKRGAMRISQYLLAARSAIHVKAISEDGDNSTLIRQIASQSGLESAQLRRWIDEIEHARDDREHPLHLWSLVSYASDSEGVDGTQTIMWQELDESMKLQAKWEESLGNLHRIVDMGRPAADDWSQDGNTFGSRPLQAGDIRFSSDPERPIIEVLPFSAAQSDSRWDMQWAPGTERDPGKVSWQQSGRTLRTRTFSISTGKVYYLVRGAGHAYAAVDSHRLIAGPLHGALTKTWDADPPGKLRWIEHDLSAYKGHRVHIEFSPRERDSKKQSEELALLSIVESSQAPCDPAPPSVLIYRKLGELGCDSVDSLARAYQTICIDALDRFGSDQITGAPDADGIAWLANWVIQNRQLFLQNDSEFVRQIAETARPFCEQAASLVGKMRRVSHTAPALLDGSSVDEYVLNRGNHRTPGPLVPRRFLRAFERSDRQAHVDTTCSELGGRVESCDGLPGDGRWLARLQPEIGSGRLKLAREMTDPANPLLARVMVNRVWHHLFGRGIVASVDNLGVLGERPTHPELMDYLARQFVEQGWSLKWLIRQIVLSSTYQMSSRAEPGAAAVDPQNLLLHRMPVRRLEGEAIRDTILALSGRYEAFMFGPSVELHLTPFMEGRGRPTASGPLDGDGRRSIYLRVRRNFPHPMLMSFDAPTPFSTIGRRSVSNVPAQALSLMNNEFVVAESKRWAHRVVDQTTSNEDRARRMFLEAYGRPCTSEELRETLRFISSQQDRLGAVSDADPRLWEDLAHILINAKEFIFIQ